MSHEDLLVIRPTSEESRFTSVCVRGKFVWMEEKGLREHLWINAPMIGGRSGRLDPETCSFREPEDECMCVLSISKVMSGEDIRDDGCRTSRTEGSGLTSI